jgi:hypothetical protein
MNTNRAYQRVFTQIEAILATLMAAAIFSAPVTAIMSLGTNTGILLT